MKKEEIEKKKSLARALYLSGMEQKEIADKVGVSAVTVSKWCTEGKWKEARAAKNITRPELVNKLLLTIDKLIEQVNTSEDATMIAGLGDKLAKLSAVIEKLDKKANVVDAIEVFMAFSKWLEYPLPDGSGTDTGTDQGYQPLPGQIHRGKHGGKPGGTVTWQPRRK